MRKIFASLAVVGVVATVAMFGLTELPAAMTLNSVDADFAQYMAQNGKSYATKEEYLYRRELFERQLAIISATNGQNSLTYRIGLNKFSDMTDFEFQRYLGDVDTGSSTETPVLM